MGFRVEDTGCVDGATQSDQWSLTDPFMMVDKKHKDAQLTKMLKQGLGSLEFKLAFEETAEATPPPSQRSARIGNDCGSSSEEGNVETQKPPSSPSRKQGTPPPSRTISKDNVAAKQPPAPAVVPKIPPMDPRAAALSEMTHWLLKQGADRRYGAAVVVSFDEAGYEPHEWLPTLKSFSPAELSGFLESVYTHFTEDGQKVNTRHVQDVIETLARYKSPLNPINSVHG